MKVKNRLKEILQELGFKTLIPTNKLLTNKLGGMTVHRFNKLLNNSGSRDMSLIEVRLFTTWLAELTSKPESEIQLLEAAVVKEVPA